MFHELLQGAQRNILEYSKLIYNVLQHGRIWRVLECSIRSLIILGKSRNWRKKWKNEWYPDTIQCQGQQDLPATIVCFKTTESHFKLQDNTHLSVHRHMTVLYIKVVATTLSITVPKEKSEQQLIWQTVFSKQECTLTRFILLQLTHHWALMNGL